MDIKYIGIVNLDGFKWPAYRIIEPPAGKPSSQITFSKVIHNADDIWFQYLVGTTVLDSAAQLPGLDGSSFSTTDTLEQEFLGYPITLRHERNSSNSAVSVSIQYWQRVPNVGSQTFCNTVRNSRTTVDLESYIFGNYPSNRNPYSLCLEVVDYNGVDYGCLCGLSAQYFIRGEASSTNTTGDFVIALSKMVSAMSLTRPLNTFFVLEGSGLEIEDPTAPSGPFDPGGFSGPGVLPPGTFDDTSDPIPDSPLPTLSAANTGFTRIYNPTLSQVQDLANYLWTDESIINTLWNHVKQFFEDPMQAIIGFNLVPCAVPDAGNKEFALMYINTGVTMNVAASQFVDVECGSVTLERYYGSALDQSPYTKVSCFLPYIGVVQLDTDEVIGNTLSIRYRIDIVAGTCVAKILVDNNVLYQYSGHCAITIPISAADFSSYVSAAISAVKTAFDVGASGVAALTGLTDPAMATGSTSTLTTTETTTARNPTTGRQITTGTKTTTQVLEESKDVSSTKASFDGLSPSNISNTVGEIMSSKPNIEHSGTFNGNTGYLGVRYPYLIIERPNMCLPENFQTLNGFPSMITMLLGECQGYTRIQQVQLTGMSGASVNEQSEILSFLKSGVIF